MNSSQPTRRTATRPAWQLPAGVSRGAWDYATDVSIATEYDSFHHGHPLLALDQQLAMDRFGAATRPNGEPKLAIDLGCGTGRNLLPLAQLGWRTIGVDLSLDMLDCLRSKADEQPELSDRVGAVYANMVQLECFRDEIADVALCMYSSLGMVQGRTNRRKVLGHANRILLPGGILLVHVHNRGSWLRDPGGLVRSVRDWIRSRWDRTWEFGDRIYPYRGLPTMFLHIYSRGELSQDLQASGFLVEDLIVLNRQSSDRLHGRWLTHVRAGGFIAVARKPSVALR